MLLTNTYFLLGTIALLALLLSVSIYFNIKIGLIVLSVEDTVEECLDIIDERYASISKVLEIPIFFDSVEVRKVVDDIRITKDALLVVANSLTSIDNKPRVGIAEPSGFKEVVDEKKSG